MTYQNSIEECQDYNKGRQEAQAIEHERFMVALRKRAVQRAWDEYLQPAPWLLQEVGITYPLVKP